MTDIQSQPLPRVILRDIDRPGEGMEVEVLGSSMLAMKAVVPSTTVTFLLRRRDTGSIFRGFLGGREFSFDPGTARKRAT